VIEVRGLTKRYGGAVAVDRLSFDVPAGAVTGFLGLNGSGKSTTMRMILGLDAPDAGHARIGGQAYRQLRWPLRQAGGLLEPRAFHPGRPARAHLAALAASNAIRQSRVDEVLELVGLESVARKRAGKFSQGRAVLVSSHLISEMALMADRLVVIGQGRLLADTTAAELSGRAPSLEEAFLQLTGDSAQYQARNMS
jgi:ABC-2 type transport system ATP-binding protein